MDVIAKTYRGLFCAYQPAQNSRKGTGHALCSVVCVPLGRHLALRNEKIESFRKSNPTFPVYPCQIIDLSLLATPSLPSPISYRRKLMGILRKSQKNRLTT